MDNSIAEPVGFSLDRFISQKEKQFPGARGAFSQMLRDIGLAARIINRELNHLGLLDIGGAFGKENVQGEEQQKLDVVANARFKRALSNSSEICALISEEEEQVVALNPDSSYIVAIDPLDGSSNIDVTVSVGTIFSIYRRISDPGTPVTEEDLLQPGRKQVASGYVIYGSSTILVYTTGTGVNAFTFSPSVGEFFLSHRDIRYPDSGSIYSINESHYFNFSDAIRQFLDECKNRGFTSRYTGSLITDFHRNMLKGGIYLYPQTAAKPEGKLRLLYECNPLAFICEQAGGKAVDGINSAVLDIEPTDIHQRTPFIVGSKNLVDMVF